MKKTGKKLLSLILVVTMMFNLCMQNVVLAADSISDDVQVNSTSESTSDYEDVQVISDTEDVTATSSSTGVQSGTFKYDLQSYYNGNTDEYSQCAVIYQYVGDLTVSELTIPETIDGYAVYGIEYYAFYDMPNLTSLYLPDSVQNLDYNIFGESYEGKTIYINTTSLLFEYAVMYDYEMYELYNFEIIGYADTDKNFEFYTTYVNEEIDGEYVETKTVQINGYKDKNATSIVIPETLYGYEVSGISNYSFDDLYSLEIVTLPDNISNIQYFICGDNFDGVINMSENAEVLYWFGVGEYDYYYNYTVNGETTDFNFYPYYETNSEGEEETIYVVSGYKSNSVTEIEIPTSIFGFEITSIGAYAFEEIDNLVTVTVPSTIDYIGSYAFGNSVDTTVNISSDTPCFNDFIYEYSDFYNLVIDDEKLDFGISLSNVEYYNGVANYDNATITITKYKGDFSVDEIYMPSTLFGYPVTSLYYTFFDSINSDVLIKVDSGSSLISDLASNGYNYEIIGAELNEDFTYEAKWVSYVNEYCVYITGYVGEDASTVTEIEIPETIEGFRVYGLESTAFDGCDSLQSVILPDDIFDIATDLSEDITFKINPGALSLYYLSVYYPNNYEFIGDFEESDYEYFVDYTRDNYEIIVRLYITGYNGYSSVTELEIPSTINGYDVYRIYYNAFEDLDSLEKLILNENIETVNTNVFSSNADPVIYLESSYPCFSSVTSSDYNYVLTDLADGEILDYVFYIESDNNTAVLTECLDTTSTTIRVPTTIMGYEVTEVWLSAFDNCSDDLEKIILPDSVWFYGDWSSKSNKIEVEVTLDSIMISDVTSSSQSEYFDYVITDCETSSYQFYINENSYYVDDVETIKKVITICGYKDTTVTELTIPETIYGYDVIGITGSAFSELTELTKVTLPDTVEYIDENAFGWEDNSGDGITIYVPNTVGISFIANLTRYDFDFVVDGYENEDTNFELSSGWYDYEGEDGNYVLEEAFEIDGYKDTSVTDLVIPETLYGFKVLSVGNKACDDLTELETLTVPENIIDFSSNVFGSDSDIAENATIYCYPNLSLLTRISQADYNYKVIGYEEEDSNFEICQGTVESSDGNGNYITYEVITVLGYKDEEVIDLEVPGTLFGYEVYRVDSYSLEDLENLQTLTVASNVNIPYYASYLLGNNAENVTLKITSDYIYFYDIISSYIYDDDVYNYEVIGYEDDSAWLDIYELNYLNYSSPDIENAFEIIRYIGSDASTVTEIEIPETIFGLDVTQIETYAFEDCTSLEKLTVTETLGYVSYNIFANGTNPTIIVPNGSLAIGSIANYDYTYEFIDGEEETDFEYSVEYYDDAYRFFITDYTGDSDITTLEIPEYINGYHVDGVYTSVFMYKNYIEYITVPDSVEYIAPNGYALDSTTYFIVSENSVAYQNGNIFSPFILDSMLDEDYLLKFIQYDYNEEPILGIGGYKGTEDLVSFTAPSSVGGVDVYGIANDSFYNYYNIDTITIPDSYMYVSDGFTWSDVTISVTENSKALELGYLYSGFKIIGTDSDFLYAFIEVYDYTIGEYTNKLGIGGYVGDDSQEITVLSDLPTAFGDTEVYGISDSAFQNCTSLEYVVVPDSYESIGWDIFCSNSAYALITEKSEAYKNDTLYSAFVMDGLDFDYSISQSEYYDDIRQRWVDGYYLKYYIADDAETVISLTMPETVLDCNIIGISSNCFENCSKLESITLSENITEVSWGIFGNNSNVKIYLLSTSVALESVKDYDYLYCCTDTGEESSEFSYFISYDENGEEYIVIDGYRFDTAIEIIVPEEINGIPVKAIESWAFAYIDSDVTVVIPNTVTELGSIIFGYDSEENIIQISQDSPVFETALTQTYAVVDIEESNGDYYYGLKKFTDNSTYEYGYLLSIVGTQTDLGSNIEIEDMEFGGYTVQAIESYAFENCSNIETLTIPNSITNVDYDIFGDYSDNTEVIILDVLSYAIEDMVEYGYNYQFASGEEITPFLYSVDSDGTVWIYGYNGTLTDTLVIPSQIYGKTVTAVSLGSEFPESSENVKTVEIPATVSYMSCSTYSNFTNIENVIIDEDNPYLMYEDGVVYSYDGTEFMCAITQGDIYIKEGVTTIEYERISASNVTIYLPSTLENVDAYTFEMCYADYVIADGNKTIFLSDGILYKKVSDTEYAVLAANVNNTSENVTILEGVTYINNIAYYAFEDTVTLSLPSTLIEENDGDNWWIYDQQYYLGFYLTNANNLESIVVADGNPYLYSEDGILYTNEDKTTIICYPSQKTDTDVVLVSTVTEVITGKISNDNIVSIELPAAFYTYSYGVLFEDMDSLESINVSADNLDLSSVDGVLYNNDITTLKMYPNTKEGDFTIPDTVTYVAYNAFYNANEITGITITENVGTFAAAYYLYRNETLEFIDVVEENQYYSSIDGVLYNKDQTSLWIVPVGKNVVDFTVPDSVTSIGWYAFKNCTTLETVVIPDSVTNISNYAFGGCDSLEIIYYEGSQEQWEEIYISIEASIPENTIIVYNFDIEIFESLSEAREIKVAEINSILDDYDEELYSEWAWEYFEELITDALSDVYSLTTVSDIENYDTSEIEKIIAGYFTEKEYEDMDNAYNAMDEFIESIATVDQSVVNTEEEALAYFKQAIETYLDENVAIKTYYGDEAEEALNDDELRETYMAEAMMIAYTSNMEIYGFTPAVTNGADGSFTLVVVFGTSSIGSDHWYDVTITASVKEAEEIIEEVKTSVSETLAKVEEVTVETAEENKEAVNEAASVIATTVSESKEVVSDDTEILEQIKAIDELYVEANAKITVEAVAPTVDDEVADVDVLPSTPVEVTGLAVSALAGTEVEEDTVLSIVVEQSATVEPEVEGTLTLDIKPYIQVGTSDPEVISNDDLQTPITFKIYLNDTFADKISADVIHTTESGTVYNYSVPVQLDADNNPFIELTVTEFSEFVVTPVSYVSGDINGDESVNSKDYMVLFQCISGYSVVVNEAALDVNGDGSVNSKDYMVLFQYISGYYVTIY
ncbi:MAG: leucine-rich repeat protein [Clostridia bacterium]